MAYGTVNTAGVGEDELEAVKASLNDHKNNKSNPHGITASQIGAASSGHKHSYNDLTDKPTIPSGVAVDNALSPSSTNPVQNKVIHTALAGKSDSGHSHSSSQVGLGNVPNVSTNNQTPTFSESSERTNISSGDTLATLFGKIKKWFADLKTVAFTGSYTDLTNKPNIPAAVTVDAQLSSNSTNPVQNKAVNAALNGKASTSHKHSVSDVTDLDKTLAELSPLKSLASRSATIVIASKNGYSKSNTLADYVCDGIDDQTEIKNAIAALPSAGGKIVFMEGTYNISSEFTIDKNVVIK